MTAMDTFPENDKRWFMHIGYLAQNWAAVETTLDGIVRQLHVHYDGEKFEPTLPQAFNRKRTFVRKAFAEHPDLAQFSGWLETLLETATRLSEVRNWALHSGWVTEGATSATLNRYSRNNPLKWENQKFTLEQMYAAGEDCAGLMLMLTWFGQRAFGAMTEEQLVEALHQLSSQLGASIPSDDPAD
ncbi:hypothetical protein LB566_10810 [Mesorhizobium sp. CA13]|uniref:hypothetical protein n=1 Tax=Mesorhizobium sp. CA13 TaxID=2876643 RepID=UPI001CCB761C|nr:hypothetical protein [Mesorhizobium sp. CA13]MBZ9854296.1 hypothetical protein [Mesorhizobium sp. CA13]